MSTTVTRQCASAVIHQGDCRAIIGDIPRESIHAVVTDPPYFIHGLDDRWSREQTRKRSDKSAVRHLPPGMKFDPQQGRRLREFMRSVGELLLPALKPGAYAACFSMPRLAYAMAAGMEDAGFWYRDLWYWTYRNSGQAKGMRLHHFIDRMALPESEKQALKQKSATGARRSCGPGSRRFWCSRNRTRELPWAIGPPTKSGS